ncbi:MAG: M4 family metallopeptidase [Xanthobacteraceae bacterium]
MAKKTRKAKKRAPARPAAKGRAFKALAMHVTEAQGRRTFQALRSERSGVAVLNFDATQPQNLDPESAAKRILAHALESRAAADLTAPTVGSTESTFKSLGVETLPLTGTRIVKFRQQLRGIPVYGSLVSVELDANNEMVSLNSNLATPDVPSFVAKVSPQDALKRAGAEAGYGRELPDVTPVLNLYLDRKGKWHLAYIVENVRIRKEPKAKGVAGHGHVPLVFDYVIDARTGSLIAALPRTPSMGAGTAQGVDELGTTQTFGIDTNGSTQVLRDTTLNIETYDFKWADPKAQPKKLPGSIYASPPAWTSAAVSAHANAAAVASFLRDVLKRNNIDDKGSRIVSSVNCIWKAYEDPPGSKNWLNAFWDPDRKQMIYGQATVDDKLRSLASSLDIVAHELFHGVTDHTSKLEYAFESGALNESYSDIFGVIISNLDEPDIAKWNWLIGDGLSTGLSAFRDFQDPSRLGHPKLMSEYLHMSQAEDYGGVHYNSGIHNFAAYNIITAADGANGRLFKPEESAAIFYIALTQQLSRQSGFSDSRRGVVLAARSLFRQLPQAAIDQRVAAIEAGFDAAEIP